MAPEWLTYTPGDKLSFEKADMFSLGCVLFWICSRTTDGKEDVDRHPYGNLTTVNHRRQLLRNMEKGDAYAPTTDNLHNIAYTTRRV